MDGRPGLSTEYASVRQDKADKADKAERKVQIEDGLRLWSCSSAWMSLSGLTLAAVPTHSLGHKVPKPDQARQGSNGNVVRATQFGAQNHSRPRDCKR
ncbi:hypothetical protein KIN_20800 [Litoreibacter roseus]|uniref:Uncharacterized protein n=1 Tax=Litoreibacter roseus TaxID=2601869 RepID=A0A6N6JFL2_9RHOB|nr:hypothetical protein KIN_20800 [Litoreibacter roseus]